MKEIKPITPNKGGIVPVSDIVGRDQEIQDFWEILAKLGIALFAERRFGKSSILRKMEAEPKEGFIVIFKHIEGLSSTADFATSLIDRATEKALIDKGFKDKLADYYNMATDVLDEVRGVKLKKYQKVWQKQIMALLDKIIEKSTGEKIVLILDEFSIFISKLDNPEAMSVLGFLRDIAHTTPYDSTVRFVYNGSIGIDLVLDKLKDGNINIGDPINHLHKYELNTFTDENAIYFGKCLAMGCTLKVEDKHVKDIISRCNNIPYYIDVVFDMLQKQQSVTDEHIKSVFTSILDDTSSKQSTQHFFTRIIKFYPNPKVSQHILNFISKGDKQSFETDIYNHVMSLVAETDRLDVNREIERLRNDGYIIRTIEDGKRYYNFKYSLLKQWWNRNKAF